MSSHRRSLDEQSTELIGLIRVAVGLLLVARPSLVSRLTRSTSTRTVLAVTRVLGVRYLAQGTLDLAVPHDPRLDSATELLHAATMIPLARRGRPHARAALLSAGFAVAMASAPLSAHLFRFVSAAIERSNELPRPLRTEVARGESRIGSVSGADELCGSRFIGGNR